MFPSYEMRSVSKFQPYHRINCQRFITNTNNIIEPHSANQHILPKTIILIHTTELGT